MKGEGEGRGRGGEGGTVRRGPSQRLVLARRLGSARLSASRRVSSDLGGSRLEAVRRKANLRVLEALADDELVVEDACEGEGEG